MTENKNDIISSLLSVGAHFGFGKSRRHATTKKRILGNKNGTDIIDMVKTADELEKAKAFLASFIKDGKKVLVVGTKPEAREIALKAAEALGLPHVTARWSGGILTNWTEIKKRIDKRNKLIKDKETGEFEKYTKKERLMLNDELTKMTVLFGGMEAMTTTPDALLIIDPRHEAIAVEEAASVRIPVIAILNTDCSMKNVTYPIVANDASRQSIKFIVDELVNACK